MNKHELIDRLSVSIATLVGGRTRYFSQDTESPSYVGHLVNMDLEVPIIKTEGIVELEVDTLCGKKVVAYQVVQWLGPAYPTLIYHHGNNEQPMAFRKTAKNTFYRLFINYKKPLNLNMIIIRAAFHEANLRQYKIQMSKLSNFTLMLSLSTRLINALTAQLKSQHSKVILAGISLGGLITNLHRTYYNSADAYVPMLAGALPGKTFMNSVYSRLTDKKALAHAQEINHILNFEQEFKKNKQPNIYPLLARYDQFVEYKIQKHSYAGHALRVVDKGHVTAVLSTDLLRQHIMEVVNLVQRE